MGTFFHQRPVTLDRKVFYVGPEKMIWNKGHQETFIVRCPTHSLRDHEILGFCTRLPTHCPSCSGEDPILETLTLLGTMQGLSVEEVPHA